MPGTDSYKRKTKVEIKVKTLVPTKYWHVCIVTTGIEEILGQIQLWAWSLCWGTWKGDRSNTECIWLYFSGNLQLRGLIVKKMRILIFLENSHNDLNIVCRYTIKMLNRAYMQELWSETVTPFYNVPNTLFEHQADAMCLLRNHRNVFLGKSSTSHCQ